MQTGSRSHLFRTKRSSSSFQMSSLSAWVRTNSWSSSVEAVTIQTSSSPSSKSGWSVGMGQQLASRAHGAAGSGIWGSTELLPLGLHHVVCRDLGQLCEVSGGDHVSLAPSCFTPPVVAQAEMTRAMRRRAGVSRYMGNRSVRSKGWHRPRSHLFREFSQPALVAGRCVFFRSLPTPDGPYSFPGLRVGRA